MADLIAAREIPTVTRLSVNAVVNGVVQGISTQADQGP
jgi:hypothetical protein